MESILQASQPPIAPDDSGLRMMSLPLPLPKGWLMPPAVVLSIAVVVGLLYRALLPKPLPGIPYNEPASHRLFGDLKEMLFPDTTRRAWISNQPRAHDSPVSQIFLAPWARSTVVVTDYREAVDICMRRTKDFDRGARVHQMVGVVAPHLHFAMQSSDPQFRLQRELLRDLMSPVFLHTVSAPVIYDRAMTLIQLWDVKRVKANGRPFGVLHDLHLGLLDVICAVAFGMENDKAALRKELHEAEAFKAAKLTLGSEDEPFQFPEVDPDPEIESILEIPDMLSMGQKAPFPYLAQYMMLLSPRHYKAWHHRRSLIRRQVLRSVKKLREHGEESKESALDQLLWREMRQAEKMGREPELFSPIIRDEVLGFLLGGHETGATVLAWFVKLLAGYQPMQTRLRNDLYRAHAAARAEGRPPTIEEITQTSIPYLDAVMEETLRFKSVVAILVRRATCDTQILGFAIPKDTDVMMCTMGPSITEPAQEIPEGLRSEACRDAKDRAPAWNNDDIHEFRPERWLRRERRSSTEEKGGQATEEEHDVFDPMAGPVLALSVGLRGCFGRKLAYLQQRTMITLMMWHFEFLPLREGLNRDKFAESMVNLPLDCFVKLKKLD